MKKFYVAPEMEVEKLAIEAQLVACSLNENGGNGQDMPNLPEWTE